MRKRTGFPGEPLGLSGALPVPRDRSSTMNMHLPFTRRRHPMNREQRVRLVVALCFATAIVAFYIWFIATHLQRVD